MSNLFAQFLQESGLYDEIEITPGNISELIDLIAGNVRIDSYCSECGSNRVFSMNPITFMVNNKGQLCDENLAAYLQHFQKALFVFGLSGRIAYQHAVFAVVRKIAYPCQDARIIRV